MESLQSDVANFSKSLVELKKLMKNVMAGNKTEEDRFRGCYLITQLKNFNAQAQSHKEEIISKTEEAKTKMIEKEELSRNFKFRVRQLEKKAEAERLFAARHISLISREQFLSQAPPRLLNLSKKSEHDENLARLEFELQNRKSLAAELASRRDLAARLENELTTRRETLRDVEPGLSGLLESTKPLLQGLELELTALGETIDFISDPNGLSDSLTAIYRQAKMREANKGDLSVSASQNEVQVTFGKKQIQFQFCPILDRVMTKANCNLEIVANDTGDNGRPNMFGEVKEAGIIGEKFHEWVKKGWRCYRWAQNVAGLELMLSEEELFEVADFDAVFTLILEKN